MKQSIAIWSISVIALVWAVIALSETLLQVSNPESLWTSFDTLNMAGSGLWALLIFFVTLIGGFIARR